MSTKIGIGALTIFVLIGGYVYLQKTTVMVQPAQNKNPEVVPAIVEMPAHKMYTVAYTDAGYTPKEITIKAGDMVVFDNQSKNEMMTAFGEHASHDEYPDKKAHPSVKAGEKTTITFPNAGTFAYHNHHAEENEGSVTVQQ